MGVKYLLQFKSPDGVAWQCDVETQSYSDAPIVVHGVSEKGAEIDYDGDNADDPYNALIKSKLTLNFYNEGQVDMDELMGAADKDFLAKFFRNGVLYWTGYLQPENIQRDFLTPPVPVQLVFGCGLAMLDTMQYVHQDLMGTTGAKNRCIMNYIRQILFVNLDIKLPIRWTNRLVCTAFGDEVFTGGVRWSPFNEGFYTYQQGVTGSALGPTQNCGYILAGILQAMQCRIYQANGKWIIRRVNDMVQGTALLYNEIPADLGVMTLASGTQHLFQRIGRGGYRFISENAVLTAVQGLKSFKTTYTANIRTNILPNGNFDILTSQLTITELVSASVLLYWGSYDTLLAIEDTSLDGRSGFSARLSSASVSDTFYTMISPGGELGKNGLPIDAFTLVPLINFGFLFSPGTGFAPVDGDGFIIWDSNPLEIKIILNQGSSVYYLNEFGFWTATDAFIPISIASLKIGDVAQVNFDKFQGVKIPQPPTQPQAGDTCDLQIIFKVKPNQTYNLDNVSITITNGNDVYEAIKDNSKNTSSDSVDLNISSSFGGYMLSNFMSAFFNSDEEFAFRDGLLYSGSLTGLNSQARMRFRYKTSQVLNTDMHVADKNWTFDEIYTVDGLLSKKFLPLNAKYYVEKAIVNMIAIEARDDVIALRENFYNSNDNQGSN